MVSAIDGRYLLNNGKQVIIALKTVAADLDMSTLESLEWVVDDLEETFKTGLHVDNVEYPLGDDRDGQVARGTIHKPSSVQVPRHRVPKMSHFRDNLQSKSRRVYVFVVILRPSRGSCLGPLLARALYGLTSPNVGNLGTSWGHVPRCSPSREVGEG